MPRKLPNNSGATAITRPTMSHPMRVLLNSGVLTGKRVLDFGCGKGKDVSHLRSAGIKVEGYDPYWRDTMPLGLFDVVTMIYVVNTLELWDDKREAVRNALCKVTPGGTLYVAIRADLRNLTGHKKGGTWQDYCPRFLEVEGFSQCHKTPGICEIWYKGAPMGRLAQVLAA